MLSVAKFHEDETREQYQTVYETDTHSVQCIQESVERDQYSSLCTINDTPFDLTRVVLVMGFRR